ncbi:Tyrosine-protein kinase Shark [Gryllus bimaculatus]|nr:Tyrosine-protein kinase Shark [Gryllus bimaculatus]
MVKSKIPYGRRWTCYSDVSFFHETMAKLLQHDFDGYVSTQDDSVHESLDVANQQLAQAVSQVQRAQREYLYQRVHEALHSQEQHMMGSLESKVSSIIDKRLSMYFKEIMQSVAEKMQKLEKSLFEKMQKLETKVMDIEQRPQLVVGGKKYESGMKEAISQAANRLEDVESLASDTASTLASLCSRVEALENQLCTSVTPATASPLLASPTSPPSDDPFASTIVHSSSDGVVSPAATTSFFFSSKCSVERKPSLTPSLDTIFRSKNDILVAVRQGNVQTALKLLVEGAAVRLSDKEMNELLHEAVKAGQDRIVSLLLNAGAKGDARNCCGETPLHVATSNNHLVIMSSLLEGYCDVNARNCDGVTALHLATRADASGQSVLLLLSKHADVAVKTARGDTPLHWAAVHGNVTAVKALLKAKASRNVRNNCGKIPWDLTESRLISKLLHPRSN